MIFLTKNFADFVIKLDAIIHESKSQFHILHTEFHKNLLNIVILINSHKFIISKSSHMNV